MMLRYTIAGLITIIIPVFSPATAHAQDLWTPPEEHSTITLEWLKPNVPGGGLGFSSAAYILTLKKPISDGDHQIVLDVPFGHASFSGGFGSTTSAGNLYIGAELNRKSEGWYSSVGLRLPFADPDVGMAVGILATQDRIEAFLPETTSLMYTGHYVKPVSDNWTINAHVGPTVWFTKSDPELLATYGLRGWYVDDDVRIGIGLTGRAILSEENLSAAERTLSQVGVTVSFPFSERFVGFHIRLPLDSDVRQDVDVIVGLHAGISL